MGATRPLTANLPRRRTYLLLALLVTVLALATSAIPAAAAPRAQTTTARPKILWGVGDTLGGAVNSNLYRDSSVGAVMHWWQSRAELSTWQLTMPRKSVDAVYSSGKSMVLVVWMFHDRDYAVSSQFQTDLGKMVDVYKGNGPMYVVLFTELETMYDKSTVAGR